MVDFIIEQKSRKLAEEDYHNCHLFERDSVPEDIEDLDQSMLEYRLSSKSYTANMSDVVINFIERGLLSDSGGYKIITESVKQSAKIRLRNLENIDFVGVYNEETEDWMYRQSEARLNTDEHVERILENGVKFVENYIEKEYHL